MIHAESVCVRLRPGRFSWRPIDISRITSMRLISPNGQPSDDPDEVGMRWLGCDKQDSASCRARSHNTPASQSGCQRTRHATRSQLDMKASHTRSNRARPDKACYTSLQIQIPIRNSAKSCRLPLSPLSPWLFAAGSSHLLTSTVTGAIPKLLWVLFS